jgi:hypothetical protein
MAFTSRKGEERKGHSEKAWRSWRLGVRYLISDNVYFSGNAKGCVNLTTTIL